MNNYILTEEEKDFKEKANKQMVDRLNEDYYQRMLETKEMIDNLNQRKENEL